MTQEKQQGLFEESLRAFINSKVCEYTLTYASIVGVLDLIKLDYIKQLQEERNKKDE